MALVDFEADNTDTAVAEAGAEGVVQPAASSADERVKAQAAKNAGKGATPAIDKAAGEAEAADNSTVTDVAVAAASTAISTAVTGKTQTLVKTMAAVDPFKAMENAIRVNYDTLDRLMVSNGNVMNKENDDLLGDTCVLDLVSFQHHWVVSPGGDKKDDESKEYLKYSDDGKVERDTGRPLSEFLDAALAAGYEKARINERVILVGELIDAGKTPELAGNLVQIDLAPRSLKNFLTHKVNTTFKVAKGRIKPEDATKVRIKAVVQKKDSDIWTDAEFSLP